MISPSQILLSVIVVFILIKTVAAYRKRELSEIFVSVWIVFWLAGLFFIFQPDLISKIAHSLKISRGVDMLIYLSLIFIFYILYRILVWVSNIEKTITELVRKLAIKEIGKRK